MQEVLRIVDVTKKSEKSQGDLRGYNLEVCRGEIVYVYGPAGSGIRTLFELLDTDRDTTDGKVLRPDGPANGIYISQEGKNLIENLTVAENMEIESGRPLYGIYRRKQVSRRAERYLEESGLSIRADMRVRKLTQTQKHLLSIVKARMQHASLVVLDCTTMTYEEQEIPQLAALLCRYRDQGVSFLILSERRGELTKISDRVQRMSRGRDLMEWYGSQLEELLANRQVKDKGELRDSSEAVHRDKEFEGILDLMGETGSSLQDRLRIIRSNNRLTWQQNVRLPDFPADRICVEGAVLIPRKSALMLCENMTDRENVLMTIQHRVSGRLLLPVRRSMEDNVMARFHEVTNIEGDRTPVADLTLVERKILSAYRWELSKPQTMLFENPFWGMDLSEEEKFLIYLRHLKKVGIRVILFSGVLSEIDRCCERIICP